MLTLIHLGEYIDTHLNEFWSNFLGLFLFWGGGGGGQAMPYNLHLFGKAKNVLGLSEKN